MFYNRTAKQTMLCNSATYVPIYQPAVGSRELPAASCQQIVDEGDSFGSGLKHKKISIKKKKEEEKEEDDKYA